MVLALPPSLAVHMRKLRTPVPPRLDRIRPVHRYSRPNPDTEEGTRWVETHGRDCPECIRKKNLAKFEEQAKKLEE